MHWERYPAHVRDRTLKAYRPVLIQVCVSVAEVLLLNIHDVRCQSLGLFEDCVAFNMNTSKCCLHWNVETH